MTLSLHNLGTQKLRLQEYRVRECYFMEITETGYKRLEVKDLKDLKFHLVTKTYLRSSISRGNLLNMKNAKLKCNCTALHAM